MQHSVAFTLEGLCVVVSLTDDLSKALPWAYAGHLFFLL